ncbi:MAG: dephospho-CoA kinase [Oligoflexia bacterium]|nr:dephospho-CoA kinase [Oligoflexia bacterium]MBF0364581.1 dephospho-CoA kinase [Oligoflexia bacterium]
MISLKSEFIRLQSKDRIYATAIPVVGITGGVASGKSSVVKILRGEGIPVIEGDQMVKAMYRQEESYAFIKKNFPFAIKGGDGSISFPALRDEFFSNGESKRKIDEFLAPKFAEFFHLYLQSLGTLPSNFIVYEYPIIFEQGLAGKFDFIAGVFIEEELQIKRLISRDFCSEKVAKSILRHQLPSKQKRDLCELVLDNSGMIDALRTEVKRLLRHLCIY